MRDWHVIVDRYKRFRLACQHDIAYTDCKDNEHRRRLANRSVGTNESDSSVRERACATVVAAAVRAKPALGGD